MARAHSPTLDTLGERLMFRSAYRRFGDHETIVATHSVDTGLSGSRTGIRWYELRRHASTGLFQLFQTGTFSPDENNRWMGSIAMDGRGDIVVGYNVSGMAYPGIRFASRLATDPSGVLSTEQVLIDGNGVQRCTFPDGTCDSKCKLKDGSCDSLDRWGDYSSMTVDPIDDCTLWYTSEYEPVSGAYNWHTRIGTVKLPQCDR